MAAPSYLHNNPLVRWIVARRMHLVKSLADVSRGEKLLDYGCGTGILFLQLPEGLAEYYGVDIDLFPAEQILAGHGRQDVKLIHANEWGRRIKDNSLDIIVAVEVLEHLDDLAEIAQLFRRKMKANGRLIVSGPTENWFYGLGRRIAKFSGEYHQRDIHDIVIELQNAGFRSVQQRTIPLPGPFALFRILSMLCNAKAHQQPLNIRESIQTRP